MGEEMSECGVCLCGGNSPDQFAMDSTIAIGFGYAQVTKDGNIVYDEALVEPKHLEEKGPDTTEWPPYWTGQDAEDAAAADPDHEWRILVHGPLSGGEWRRSASSVWTLVKDLGGLA